MFEEREKPEYSKTNLFFLARRHRFRGNRTRVCWLECLLLPLLHSFFHAPYSLTQLLFYYPTTHFSTFPSPIPNCPPMSLLLYSLLPCFLLFFTLYSSTPFSQLFFPSPYFPTAHTPLLPPPLVLCSSASPIPTPYLTTPLLRHPLLFYLHTPLNPWCLLFPTPQFVPISLTVGYTVQVQLGCYYFQILCLESLI